MRFSYDQKELDKGYVTEFPFNYGTLYVAWLLSSIMHVSSTMAFVRDQEENRHAYLKGYLKSTSQLYRKCQCPNAKEKKTIDTVNAGRLFVMGNAE